MESVLLFCVISLIAVVSPNDVFTVATAFLMRASSVSSSGCQSGEYFISKRAIVMSSGAWVAPVLVRIQPDGELDSVVCSRPIGVPRRKMPNEASPGAGVAGRLRRGGGRREHQSGRRAGGTMKRH